MGIFKQDPFKGYWKLVEEPDKVWYGKGGNKTRKTLAGFGIRWVKPDAESPGKPPFSTSITFFRDNRNSPWYPSNNAQELVDDGTIPAAVLEEATRVVNEKFRR